MTSQLAMHPLLLPWWEWLILLVALTAAVCFIAWFVLKKLKTRIRSRNIEFSSSSDNPTVVPYSPHTVCEHRWSLEKILKSIMVLTTQIHDLQNRGILAEQMLKAEEHILHMKNACLQAFTSALKKKLKANNDPTVPVRHSDYADFRHILQEYVTQLKDVIRAACIHNGFSEKDTKDYNDYVMTKISQIRDSAIQYLNENYDELATTIHVDDFMSDGTFFISNMQPILQRLFDDIRNIYVMKNKEIDEIIKERQDIIYQELGLTK